MKDIKIIFMGTPAFSVPVLEALIENYNVVGVVTQPDKIVGREKKPSFPPVKECAIQNHISVFQPEKIRNNYQNILAQNPDIIITCAYGQIIPKEILDYPKYGCINVHASLLPKLRGGAPIHHAIIDGYAKTGITIMYMDEKMDTGDMISTVETAIVDEDTVGSLHDRLSMMGKELLLETLTQIFQNTATRTKQNHEEATYAWNIKKEEEFVCFDKTSKEIFNQIRGLNPFPGAYGILEDKIYKIYHSKIGMKIGKTPGEIIALYEDGIGIATKDGEIIITEIKPFGKKTMTVKNYLNGLHEKQKLLGKRFLI